MLFFIKLIQQFFQNNQVTSLQKLLDFCKNYAASDLILAIYLQKYKSLNSI